MHRVFILVLVITTSLFLSGCSLGGHFSNSQKFSPKIFQKYVKSNNKPKPRHEVSSLKNGVVIYKDNEGYKDPRAEFVVTPYSNNSDIKFGPQDITFGGERR